MYSFRGLYKGDENHISFFSPAKPTKICIVTFYLKETVKKNEMYINAKEMVANK